MGEKLYKVFVWALETIYHILKYIAEGLIVLVICFIIARMFENEMENSTVHEEYNMCHIDNIHTYEMDTMIVYIETGLFSYTPYISENGNYYKYNPETKEMIEIKSEE